MASPWLSFCSGVVWAEPHQCHGILENVTALNLLLSDLDLLQNAHPHGSAFVLMRRSVLAIECDLNS
jgi:hypothetical protein